MISKIISGGQTGVDRAALDWAMDRNLPHAGWCPAGRRAEDGPLDTRYRLQETPGPGYRARTVRNIVDAEATLIANLGEMGGGTLETWRIAQRRDKPVRIAQLDDLSPDAVAELFRWLAEARIQILNVAGPRESKCPGIYRATYEFLDRVLGGQGKAKKD